MGNFMQSHLLKKSHSLSEIKKKFIESIILDKDKQIIIGIWNNPNKLNTLGNQGIWIGNNNDIYENKIYQLTFGMSNISHDYVILYFENKIKLKFYKNSTDNKLYFVLMQFNQEYNRELTQDILKNIQKFNKDSPDLDLLFSFINKHNYN
jgi:hypothetical protein